MKQDTSYAAMVLGATGNVGGRIVQLLVRSPRCRIVVVVTRRRTGAWADEKVREVVVEMDRLEEQLAAQVDGVDIALAAFGVGKGSAMMPEDEVRRIEVDYPAAFCRAARRAGARVAGVMTAMGANPQARTRYTRILGEKEKAIEALQFDFLGLYRPAVMLGNSNTPGWLNAAMPLVHWAMPRKYWSVHKNDLARAMVAQSEEAWVTQQQRVVKILEYPEMEPYFVKGERDG